MKTNNSTLNPMLPSTMGVKSLFDSILMAENQLSIDAEISKYAQRVGFILKVCYARDLSSIRETFISCLDELVRDTANSIDNELPKTEATAKSEV